MNCSTNSCERVAKIEVRTDSLENMMEQLEDRTNKRLDKQEKLVESIYEIASIQKSMITTQEKMSDKIDNMNTNMDLFNKELIEVKNKPNNDKAKKWDATTFEIVKYVGIAMLAYLVGMIFPFLAK